MKVINLYGGPGAGKSTTAAELFACMKKWGLSVEYVFEQAKNFTWEDRHRTLQCQPYVFSKQLRDLWRLDGQVEYAITDSPLLLALAYGPLGPTKWPSSFYSYVLDQSNMFDNYNIFLERRKSYVKVGRNQTEEEAHALDNTIWNMLVKHQIAVEKVPANVDPISRILGINNLFCSENA